jgi:hypothetical protein
MTPGQIKRTAAKRARNMGLSYAGARAVQEPMSALPPKADMCGATWDVLCANSRNRTCVFKIIKEAAKCDGLE